MSELVIAFDTPGLAEARELAKKLEGLDVWAKVGMELFTAAGPAVVEELKSRGLKVFLDLKFFDIPNTVRGGVRSAVRIGADMVNVHALGGRRMLEAAVEARDQGAQAGHKPLLLAVTVLTSMDERDAIFLRPGPLPQLVADLAQHTAECGLDGVVCSAREVGDVKQACGAGFLCLTPGIRPAGGLVSGGDDQRRVLTPAQAVSAGSDFLVVGRPVTGADSPAEAAAGIIRQMGEAD